MTVGALLRFLAIAAVTAVVLHLSLAVGVVYVLHRNYPHRIFSVRAWSDEGTRRFRLVGTFLNETARSDSEAIAFIGSSVTYGYPWDTRFVFTKLFADRHPHRRVLNPSLIAADVSGINDWIVCGAVRNAVHFAVAVVEIPVVNTTSYLVQARQQGGNAPQPRRCTGEPDSGYWSLALLNTRGLGWLGLLSNNDSRLTTDVVAQIGPVAKGYFTSAADFDVVRDDYLRRIETLLRNTRSIADRVYVFASPIFLGGLHEIGEDTAAVTEQLRLTEVASASVHGVRYIDTSALWFNRAYYFNLTHLNQAGHRATAALFEAAIEMPDDKRIR